MLTSIFTISILLILLGIFMSVLGIQIQQYVEELKHLGYLDTKKDTNLKLWINSNMLSYLSFILLFLNIIFIFNLIYYGIF